MFERLFLYVTALIPSRRTEEQQNLFALSCAYQCPTLVGSDLGWGRVMKKLTRIGHWCIYPSLVSSYEFK